MLNEKSVENTIICLTYVVNIIFFINREKLYN